MKTDSFIDGSWVGVVACQDVFDFFIGVLIVSVVNVLVEDCLVVVWVADWVWLVWWQIVFWQWGEILCKVFELMMICQWELVELICWENGKILVDVMVEVVYVVEFFCWYLEEVVCIDGEYCRVFSGVYWILVICQLVGVGCKIYDERGYELVVVIELGYQGWGWVCQLVIQVVCRVLVDGVVLIYLYAFTNVVLVCIVDVLGFVDWGWQIFGLFLGWLGVLLL